jgi:hypothetical protein
VKRFTFFLVSVLYPLITPSPLRLLRGGYDNVHTLTIFGCACLNLNFRCDVRFLVWAENWGSDPLILSLLRLILLWKSSLTKAKGTRSYRVFVLDQDYVENANHIEIIECGHTS